MRKNLTYNLIKLVIMILFFGIALSIFLMNSNNSIEKVEVLDFKIFSAFVLTIIVEGLVVLIIDRIHDRAEEKNRLNQDTRYLQSIYEGQTFFKYNNLTYPIADYVNLKNKKINIIQDSKQEYNLPALIKENYFEILESYKFSKLYNSIAIRLDSAIETSDTFNIKVSRTQYFYSAVTNRALDFKLTSKVTIRSLYPTFNKKLHSLEESPFSNHIGFDMVTVTKDNYIVFIKRNLKRVNRNRSKYGFAVSASLKAHYALDDENNLHYDGFLEAVKKEMYNEILIDETDIDSKGIEFLYFYREVTEGGKPQFLLRSKLNITKDELVSKFKQRVKKNSNIDGEKFLFIKDTKIFNLKFGLDTMIIDKRKYIFSINTIGLLLLYKDFN